MAYRAALAPPAAPATAAWLALAPLLWLAITASSARAQDAPGGTEPAPPAARTVPDALNFANGLYKARRYELAADEYESFLRTAEPGPDAADARYGLASSLLALGKYKDARSQFEAFLNLAPNHPNAPAARFRVGETSYLISDLETARDALETYLRQHPNHKNAEYAWPYLGEVYLRLKDLPQARRAYEQSLEKYPTGQLVDRARYGLGSTLSAQGDIEGALTQFKALAERGGEWTDKAQFQVGQVQKGAGRFAEAADAFEALERLAPKSPLLTQARLNRAESLIKLGRRDEAEAFLKPLTQDPAGDLAIRAGYLLGESLWDRNKPAEARAAWDDALRRNPKGELATALTFRSAEAALKLGRTVEARTLFLRAAEIDRKDPWADDALVRAATLAFEARDFVSARRLAGSFTARFGSGPNPLAADAHLIEARAALTAGQPKEAVAILQGLLAEDNPRPATAQAARYYLGLALKAGGEGEKASAVLNELAGMPSAPVATDARFLVGQSHFEAKRYAEAANAFDRYLADKAKGEVADHALAYLALARSELGQADAAHAAVDRLAREFPKSPLIAPTRLRLAETHLRAKQYAEAGELFEKALESAGTDAKLSTRARSGLSWCLWHLNQPADAAASFETVAASAPADDPLAAEAALMAGRSWDRAGQPEKALAAFDQVLTKFTGSNQVSGAVLGKARLLARTGKPLDAARAFEAFLKANPQGGTGADAPDHVLADWGWALVEADRTAESDAIFRRLLTDYPTSPRAADARVNLAESAAAAKDYTQVETLLKPLVEETAPPAGVEPALLRQALDRWGRTQIERKDWNGATTTFNRLAKLAADAPETDASAASRAREARFWQAEVAFQAGDAASAETAFAGLLAEPVAANGANADAWIKTAKVRRAQALVLLERWNDALKAADLARADLAPEASERAEVDYARGRALQGLARFEESRQAYQLVIDARQGGELAARAQLMRGETYFHNKELRPALREFLKVDILYDAPPWQAAALLEAGKVYEQLGQWANAADTYERLKFKFPKDSLVAEADRRRADAIRKAGGSAAKSKNDEVR